METLHNKNTPSQYAILDVIKDRWSPRAFQETAITEQHINQLLEAARWAASSYNAQPWRFIFAHRGSTAHEKLLKVIVPGNQTWARQAPLLILTAVKKDFDNGKVNFHAVHDLGQAVANLSIQAQALGIGLHQMAGLDRTQAAVEFEVPAAFEVITAIAGGYYGGDLTQLPEKMQAAEKRERTRMAVSDFSAEGKWPS